MKNLGLIFMMLFWCLQGQAQDKMYQLSSHILDITEGKPVSNVDITLFQLNDQKQWVALTTLKTDENGRVKSFLPQNKLKENKGVYKLKFETYKYFDQRQIETFYPFIEVVFKIEDDKHYHVPITISPFGYSTYRGS